MKKYIKYIILAAVLIGMIFTKGNIFELINIVIVIPIANILYVIYNVIGDFGLAILIFTVLVKLCMWPLTKNQLHQTKLMKKIQPELTEIRKRCNGNKQMESLQTMDLYKKYNIKPLGSILTLVIQLPIFIALYSAIRVMVLPTATDNLESRAYSFVQYESSPVAEVINLQRPYLNDLTNDDIPVENKSSYDFHPQLFHIIPLDGVANAVFQHDYSLGVIFALICTASASLSQYFVVKQQQPSNKSTKSKKFRDILKEADNNNDINQADITAMTTQSMNKIMPIMLFLIMFNLPGALVFYYFLSNLFSLVQQKIIFSKTSKELDDSTDKAILKELKNIKEAKVIENKKTGTKITRISAKDNKKKRR